MKRNMLLLLALIVSTAMMAGPVTQDEALTKAKAFVSAKSQQVGGPRRVQLAHQQMTLAQTAGNALYYVFNIGEKNGFVLVSGDDRTPAILGYCDEGTFDPDNMPDNMRAWLQGYADQLEWLQKHPEAAIQGDEVAEEQGNEAQAAQPGIVKMPAKASVKTAVSPLIQSMWDQGNPYNLSCPSVTYRVSDGQGGYVYQTQYCLTGCVATAMAQVMNYWQWPKQTKADIDGSYYSKKVNTQYDGQLTMTAKSFAAGTSIDWDNMLDVYGSGANDAQKTAVAELMAMCGIAVQMNYGLNSSGSSVSASHMIDYFDYSATTHDVSRADYSLTEWNNLIYAEVAAGRPVLYDGQSSGGGHEFVVDGYDGDELFHVNWGWSGSSNGYFLLSVLNPHNTTGSGASSSDDGYSFLNGAIIGLQPNHGESAEDIIVKMSSSIISIDANDGTITSSYFNYTGNTYRFNFGIGYVDSEGAITSIGNYSVSANLSTGWGYSARSFNIGSLPDGTYKIVPISKENGTSTWYPNMNPSAQFVEVVISGGEIVSMVLYPDVTASNFDFPGLKVVNTEQKVTADVSCTQGEFYGPLYLFANQTGTLEGDPVSTAGITVLAGVPVQFEASFTPNATGTWYVWITKDSDGNEVIGTSSVEIEDSPTEAYSLSAQDLTIENGNPSSTSGGNIYGTRIKGLFLLENTGTTTFNDNVTIQLFKYMTYNGTLSYWSSDKQTIATTIAAGETKAIEFDFNNQEKTKYLVRCTYGNTYTLYPTYSSYVLTDGVEVFLADGTSSATGAQSNVTTPANAAAVNLTGVSGVTNVTGGNENTLFIFGADDDVPSSLNGRNVVKGVNAENITLRDGTDFYTPITFTAQNISYTRTFADTETLQRTPTGGALGWTTMTLPFDVSSVTVDLTKDNSSYPSAYPLDWFHSANDSGKNFWVMEFSSETGTTVNFDYADKMKASRPYLIGIPSSDWGADNDLTGYSITFHGENVAINKNFHSGITGDIFKMKGTLVKKTGITDVYVMNDEGSAFVKNPLGSNVNPFRAYFEATSTANLAKQLTIGFGDDDEGETTALGGILVNSSTVQRFNSSTVYDLSGRKVKDNSQLTIDNMQLPKGVYIVNGKKVIIK